MKPRSVSIQFLQSLVGCGGAVMVLASATALLVASAQTVPERPPRLEEFGTGPSHRF